MALIPCAVFALRIKVRTLFGIKVSLYVEINYTFFYVFRKLLLHSMIFELLYMLITSYFFLTNLKLVVKTFRS